MSIPKPAAGNRLLSIMSGAEPPNGLQGSRVKVYSFVIVGLSSCSVFFCFDLIALVLKNLTLWVVMHVDSKLNPLLGMFW